jgi:uncharacterized repeat protein (TIGR03806 family)
MRKTLLFLLLFFIILSAKKTDKIPHTFKEKLSDYAFFEGTLKEQKPAKNVLPYTLNAPLFSDYAYKLRFVQVPENQTVVFNPDSVFQFPKGTALIKTFYYPLDFRHEKKGRRLVETRVLLHEEKGWVSLPYIWNEAQTEAYLEVAGGSTTVNWLDEKGKKQTLDYTIPNLNQCKGCHERNGVMTPIGPSARQLNGDFAYTEGTENQLIKWKKANILMAHPDKSGKGFLDNLNDVTKTVHYDNTHESLDARARAYLDINCAHCHNRQGPAQTSGLFLDWQTTDSTARGFYKTPVAAGRGSGNLKYSIVPGKPNESILFYRMESLDPGVMMPEMSRKLRHTEGIKLIREWIASMK